MIMVTTVERMISQLQNKEKKRLAGCGFSIQRQEPEAPSCGFRFCLCTTVAQLQRKM